MNTVHPFRRAWGADERLGRDVLGIAQALEDLAHRRLRIGRSTVAGCLDVGAELIEQLVSA